MSSTTERERGQVLVLFAGALVALLIVAALAFDVGAMLLERRDQQNAADAAAIAGARYLPDNRAAAIAAARDVASANGFTNASASVTVETAVPPGPGTSSLYRNNSSIEVTIASTRPSIFAGVMGVVGWPVGARAVATNQDDVAAPYAILALEEHQCSALYVGGGGRIEVNGNIQVNSDCNAPGQGALERKAGAIEPLTVDADPALCNVVGGIKSTGSGDLNCDRVTGAQPADDPLADLQAPPQPEVAHDMELISGGAADLKPPDGCPGSDIPATAESPALCKFAPSAEYQTAVWRMYPGLYPGGIDLQVGTFYLEPGIYWIGGGGFQAGGNGVTLMSVASGTTGPIDFGVLLYNTSLPTSPMGTIVLNGADATIGLYPLKDGSLWDGLVVFMDRTDIGGDSVDDVTINGGSSEMDVRGTIYVPDGQIKVNGSGGTIVIDQIIADQFKVTGSGGTIRALYDPDFVVKFTAAGLVE